MTAPRLTRQNPPPPAGMVHFGPGAFFRAFVAPFTAEAGGWGIAAVSLQSPTVRDALAPQGWSYTSVTQAPQAPPPQRIEVLREVLVAPEDPGAVLARLVAPETRLVTLTITEKGYCYSPATGTLDASHPLIAHDLAHPDQPRTAPGFLVAALRQRRAAGLPPFTVLSCDNLPDNGRVTANVVAALAQAQTQAQDPDLAGYIRANVAFPSCMVDRITPATTEADNAALAEVAGYHDPACVIHEPFRQWVIEDHFPQGRPDWAAAGATLTRDVAPWEAMKLRCLNGTHSAMAYLGYLAGHETVAEAAGDPVFAAYLQRLWSEITPTLDAPEGADVPAYCAALLERYRNPAIRHRLWQIAMDGSQKLPQRLLGPLAQQVEAGAPALLCAVAGWMRYVGAVDEAGQPIDVRDPLAQEIAAQLRGAEDAAARVDRLLAMQQIFDPGLAARPALRDGLVAALHKLETQGARATLKELCT